MTSDLIFEVFPFAAALIALGVACRRYTADAKNAAAAKAASAWPVVPGQVRSAEVVERITTQPNGYTGETKYVSYEAKVAYDYSVAGKSFTGGRLNFRRDDYSTDAEAKKAVAKFPAGSPVAVAYDPADPSSSVLDRDTALPALSSKTWQMLAVAIIFASVGVYVVYGANRG